MDTGTAATEVLLPEELEIYASSLWFDCPYTGSVTDVQAIGSAPTRGFKCHNYESWSVENSGTANPTSATAPEFITVTGWWVEGGAALGLGAHNFRWSNGDIGGYRYNNTSDSAALLLVSNVVKGALVETNIAGRNGSTATNIVLDHTFLHDINNNAPNFDPHDGCMFVHLNVNEVLFDSNVWRGCWVYAIQVQGSAPMDNVTIQNNWFQCGAEVYKTTGNMTTCGQNPVQFDGSGYSNWLIRYNTFRSDSSVGCYSSPCTLTNIKFIGNTGQKPTAEICSKGVFDRNAWVGGTCGGSDVSVASNFVVNQAVGSENFHLTGGNQTGIDNVITETSSDYAIPKDIDNTTRPVGAARDVGSDER
jgi:hypothetical protein